MQILTDKGVSGWQGLIYGAGGIGKSTLAAQAPNPLFIDLENGIARYGFARTPLIKTLEEFKDSLRFFFNSEYETAVIDTVDFLETIIHEDVCAKHGWKNMEAAGYGKAYMVAQKTWLDLLGIFEKISVEKKKNILLIGHDQIRTFAPPDGDAYDRYSIKLNKNSANLIIGKMDFVFLAQFETMLKTDRTHEDRLRAIGTGRRILRTQEAPAWIAKNRFGLESTVAMDATIFEKLV
jgi:hypothetical protein